MSANRTSVSPAARDPIATATLFVKQHYPACATAFLAGSVVAGTATASSDLDIVVIVPDEQPRWMTLIAFNWPIEVFILTPDGYRDAFARNVQLRRPLLLALCASGVVLVDRAGVAQQVREEAARLLAAGPPPLTEEEIAACRHELTWMRDDFADAVDLDEARMMAPDLAVTAARVYLAYHRHWLGLGKWLLRELRAADADRARMFTQALTAIHCKGEKAPLLAFADEMLDLVGGPRFGGVSGEW